MYVLYGKGTLTMGGDQYLIAPGDLVGFPRHTVAHSISNDGTETLVCLVIGQRLDQDVGDHSNIARTHAGITGDL